LVKDDVGGSGGRMAGRLTPVGEGAVRAIGRAGRVFKNKHRAVGQGRYKLEARGLRLEAQKNQAPSAMLPASRFQPIACEHLQKPRNAGARPEAPFFNILSKRRSA
jgi:hypothetical protein